MHLANEPGPLLGMHHLLEVCVTIELLVGRPVCLLDDDVVVLIGAGVVVGWVAMQLNAGREVGELVYLDCLPL